MLAKKFLSILSVQVVLASSILFFNTDCFADPEAEALQARIDAGEAENDMEEARREARDSAIIDGASASNLAGENARIVEDEDTMVENRRLEADAEDREEREDRIERER